MVHLFSDSTLHNTLGPIMMLDLHQTLLAGKEKVGLQIFNSQEDLVKSPLK